MRPFRYFPSPLLVFAAACLAGCGMTPALVATDAAPPPARATALPTVDDGDDFVFHEVSAAGVAALPAEYVVLSQLRAAEDIWTGTPYEFGGTTRFGIDCSAFVQRVFADDFGLGLSRSTHSQVREGREVRRQDLQPGDLVFFRNGRQQHVGIYLRDGEFLHASTSRGVTTDRLSGYFDRTFWTARRVLTPEQIASLVPAVPPSLASSEAHPRRAPAAQRPARPGPPPPPPGARISERPVPSSLPASASRRSGW